MEKIGFDKDEKALLVRRLQRYFDTELGQPLGQFDAEFLLDFLSREMGAHWYNRGVRDAQALLAARLDDVQDALYQLEQPTESKR